MKFSRSLYLAVTLMLLLFSSTSAFSSGKTGNHANPKTAIVVAQFGSTVPAALQSITNITDAVRGAYPETEVRITFTSNIIRRVWKQRQAEPQQWLDKGIPEEVLYVKNFIATVGDLLEDGYTNIIVQPTHMFYMEQSYDLQQYVNALGSINTMKERWKPINSIVMGRPALGKPGDIYPYHEDVDKVIQTLAGDVEQARKNNSMLVYMGHGNKYWSTGIYAETQKKMRELYPDIETYIGVVEGSPSVEDVLAQMKNSDKKQVTLVPFMIVAGDHAVNDMAGDEEDSWKSILAQAGYEVTPILQGLGSNDDFAKIFVSHIADAANEAGIEIR